MELRSITYREFVGSPQEWVLEGLTLKPINLLVGKNASGKTRTLNVINALALSLANKRKPGLGSDYDVVFEHEGKNLRYRLRIEDEQVLSEEFSVDGKVYLARGDRGEGEIFAEEIDNGKMIRFQTPQNELAAVARQDAIQHKFLKPLADWGRDLRHFCFGSTLGKSNFAVFMDKGGTLFDETDVNAVVALYRHGEKKFQEPFKKAVISDMLRLDYPIEDLGVQPPVSIRVKAGPPGELVGLFVKEKGLNGVTDQHSMSQGMYRALAILIHLSYSWFTHQPTCILIDDIGEGLDFDRSCRLIDLLRAKAKESSVQLVLSTNDRFVMNHVPLDEWSVLQRKGSHVRVLNSENARALFDEFKFTGLSNFSFLEMDFASGAPMEEGVAP